MACNGGRKEVPMFVAGWIMLSARLKRRVTLLSRRSDLLSGATRLAPLHILPPVSRMEKKSHWCPAFIKKKREDESITPSTPCAWHPRLHGAYQSSRGRREAASLWAVWEEACSRPSRTNSMRFTVNSHMGLCTWFTLFTVVCFNISVSVVRSGYQRTRKELAFCIKLDKRKKGKNAFTYLTWVNCAWYTGI